MKETRFKQTDRGLFPTDWSEITLAEIGSTYNGLTGKTKSDFGHGNAKYITFLNVLNNPILKSELHESVMVDVGERQNYTKKGDIFFNTSSETPEEVGICSFLNENLPNLFLNSFCFGFRVKNSNVEPLFLTYYFRSKIGRNLMSLLAQGVTRYNISKSAFNKGTIVVPPTKSEQQRIADALGDVDKLIASLERLIEKKRMVKQGTMQQLLTGKLRLPGFDKPWGTFKIKNFAEVVTGATPSTDCPNYWGGNIRWMSSGELNLKNVYEVHGRITQEGYDSTSTHMLPKYSILIGLAGQGKTRGTCAINHIELCTNQSIGAILPKEKMDNFFLYYLMDTQYDNLRALSSGDGGRGGLTKTHLEEYEIYIPSDIEEQRAIAKTLTDMDAEIAALEAKLNKYKDIKSGMMQQLLTGKIRLI